MTTPRTPDISGAFGHAWKARHVPKPGDPPDWQGQVVTYLVKRPGAHPFWMHWAITVVHLQAILAVGPNWIGYQVTEKTIAGFINELQEWIRNNVEPK